MVGLVRCRWSPTSSFATCDSTAFARSASRSSSMTFTRCATPSCASARPGAALIVTSSRKPPGCRSSSRPSSAPFETTWTARFRTTKPGSSAASTYDPAGTRSKRKAPLASLRVVAAIAPSGLTSVTSTPEAGAPAMSVIVPATLPSAASGAAGRAAINAAAQASERTRLMGAPF